MYKKYIKDFEEIKRACELVKKLGPDIEVAKKHYQQFQKYNSISLNEAIKAHKYVSSLNLDWQKLYGTWKEIAVLSKSIDITRIKKSQNIALEFQSQLKLMNSNKYELLRKYLNDAYSHIYNGVDNQSITSDDVQIIYKEIPDDIIDVVTSVPGAQDVENKIIASEGTTEEKKLNIMAFRAILSHILLSAPEKTKLFIDKALHIHQNPAIALLTTYATLISIGAWIFSLFK
ncbi:MAG: hypothetical protein LBT51_10540 [Fusobacteriaceae bacterium]|nr:hypothetical protein [Fusobacteriaceae bacterium]